MRESTKYRIYRKILFCTAFAMLAELFTPTVAWALTSGPAQPEFSSFEPVATTNMVNEFSGDFTYNLPVLNIPGANGGGYSMSLSYHSGASPEEEASWVGYGWTLNPGAINRGKRGFPDDYKGETVNYWNKVPSNRTVSIGGSVDLEVFSFDGVSTSASLRYNNYKGFGTTIGAGLKLAKGAISLGYSVSDGEGSFSAKINPAKLLSKSSKGEKARAQQERYKKDPSDRKKDAHEARKKDLGTFTLFGSNYGIASHGEIVRPVQATKYEGGSYNVSPAIMATLFPIQVGPSYNLSGNYTWQRNVNSAGEAGVADPLNAYGYMYSYAATSNGSQMMDYYTEKLNPYDNQDRHLGIPFSNADNFMVTGEAIGGGFRIRNKNAGHFRPNAQSSNLHIVNVSPEVEAGLDIGAGGDVGVGFQSLSVNNWSNSTVQNYKFAGTDTLSDEPYFFRFNNDLGGSIEFGSDALQQATLTGGGAHGAKDFNPALYGITTQMSSRSGRSSYIAYHTNKEMGYTINSKPYKAYTLSDDINGLIDRSSVENGIGELTVFNEDGTRYNYGLPVYSRKEIDMQYDLQGVSGSQIDNNYLAYRDISVDDNLKSKVGEERDAPYATSFLLTDITTPDYTDRTLDGPTSDDFGGYTRFSYKRAYGSCTVKNDYTNTNWYRWRIPYTGLLYNRGELSTQKDDMGSVTTGEKEIYYLDTIETNTHYAVFITSDRTDGYAAAANNTAASDNTAKDSSKKLQKLDRIELYAKNNGSPKLIKTTRFEYYTSTDELCKYIPNGAASNQGKLTLKKVWFEYEGAVNAKISPYTFEYAYPTTAYPTKYNDIDSLGTGLTQNPDYSPFSLDAWGNYQENGANRFDSLRTWVDQAPAATFDPSAWQLKVIKLPTGGEIHVQYEQDDYAYVQDKPVHAMVSLQNSVSSDDDSKYYLNISDIGLSTTEDKAALRNKINDLYVIPGKKMHFKFLYSLIGTGTPALDKCTSEYISGYCNVKSVGVDANGVYIELGNFSSSSGKHDLPKKVCKDYLKTQRAGNLNLSGNCDADAVGVGENSKAKNVVHQLVGFIGTKLIPGINCAEVNYGLSYLRVPMITAKKGGGLRVKRLLMYDKGLETGDAVLFGSEYIYKETNGSSSGVATNEPSAMREENALIDFDEKLKQTFLNKVVSGRDKEQAEKPLGETILPSPSVGYSRVLIKNIHSGKTNTGFAVKEYYTAHDFPMTADNTDIQTAKDYFLLPGGLVNYFVNNLWTTQGYTFTLNSMHGQPRREATYAGDPSDGKAVLSTEQVYTYYTPGESIPVMSDINTVTNTNMGKEMELVFESRRTEDICNDMALEFDVSIGLFGIFPLPYATAVPSYTYTESKMHTHVTSKVVSYPAILKSTLTYADGIYHLTENLAFNKETGKPIVTRTTDGFDKLSLESSSNHSGTFTNYVIPAAHQYESMGPKAENERAIIKSDAGTVKVEKKYDSGHYYLEFTAAGGYSVCDAMGKLSAGDLIKLNKLPASGGADLGLFHVSDSLVGNKLFILPTAAYTTNSTSSFEVIAEVVKSGKTNQLSTNVGSYTTYGESSLSSPAFTADDSLELSRRETLAHKLDSIAALGAGELTAAQLPPGTCIKSTYTFDHMAISTTGGMLTLSSYTGMPGAGPSLDCSEEIGPEGGSVAINPKTYGLTYYPPGNSCRGKEISCVTFCSGLSPSSRVLAANAQTFSDNWSYDTAVYAAVDGSNTYENGAKGKWRNESNYVYRDTITGANRSSERIYKDAGVFNFKLFNWKSLPVNDTTYWVKLTTVTNYSPDGNAMEEKDIQGIYSAAKFGYNHTVPYLVAKNADYQSVQFESFENLYNSTEFEDGWGPADFQYDQNYAHSGKASIRLDAPTSTYQKVDLKPLAVTQQILDNGLLLKAWVRDTSDVDGIAVKGYIAFTGYTIPYTFTKVARTGEWTLFEAKLDASYFSDALDDTIIPWIENNYTSSSGGTIWVDDVRVQPQDAQMICYVYDPNTLRLIASFDDQHFGLYYQYNGEGKLVRKLAETEKGIKTITETQYHAPTSQR